GGPGRAVRHGGGGVALVRRRSPEEVRQTARAVRGGHDLSIVAPYSAAATSLAGLPDLPGPAGAPRHAVDARVDLVDVEGRHRLPADDDARVTRLEHPARDVPRTEQAERL